MGGLSLLGGHRQFRFPDAIAGEEALCVSGESAAPFSSCRVPEQRAEQWCSTLIYCQTLDELDKRD